MDLWHYTCDHGRTKIGDRGRLLPGVLLVPPGKVAPPQSQWVWLTDLDHPDAQGLGLTMNEIRCDRTVHRYRVDAISGIIRPWADVRLSLDATIRKDLERTDGAMPEHWFVSRFPVRVTYDPIEEVVADVH